MHTILCRFSVITAILVFWGLWVPPSGAACFPSGLVTYSLTTSGSWDSVPNETCSGVMSSGPIDYQVQPFWVDVAGSYRFEWGGEGSFIVLFADAFDPTMPLSNCLEGDLAELIFMGHYAGFEASLDAHRQYYLVSTNVDGFASFAAPSLWGVGQIHLELFPGLGSNLQLSSSVDPSMPGALGGNLELSFEVDNLGGSEQDDVTVSSPMSTALTYVSDTCGGAMVDDDWVWDVGSLSSTESSSCEVVASYLQCRSIEQSASVRGGAPEPLDDNSDVFSVVPPATDPVMDGGFELGTPNPFWGPIPVTGDGHSGTFRLVLESPSAQASQTLTLPESSDAWLTFYLERRPTFQAGGGFTVYLDGVPLQSYAPNNVSESAYVEFCWQQEAIDVSAFADGKSHVLQFLQSDDPAPGSFGIDDVAIEVCPPLGGDLAVSLSTETPLPGTRQTTHFDVEVEHLGGQAQSQVEVSVALPESLAYAGDSCGGSFDAGLWTWNVGLLTSGVIAGCDLDVIYGQCGEFEVEAQVAGTVFDAPHNNTSTLILGDGSQVVSDGGFELGNPHPDWVSTHSANFFTLLCGDGTTSCATLPGFWGPNSGDVWAWLRGTTSTPFSRLEQQVTIPSGGDGFLEFWLRIRESDGLDDYLQVSIDGVDVLLQDEGSAPYIDGYHRVLLDVSPWADDLAHDLVFTAPTTGTAEFHIDDVALSVCQRGPIECPGSSDPTDGDGDGVPDACDLCADEDDLFDSDLDQVPDGCDLCPGYDDALDTDSDQIADGCDPCINVDMDDVCSQFDCDDNDPTNACNLFRDGFEGGGLEGWSSSAGGSG